MKKNRLKMYFTIPVFVMVGLISLPNITFNAHAQQNTPQHRFWSGSGTSFTGKTCTATLEVYNNHAKQGSVWVQIGNGKRHEVFQNNMRNERLTKTTTGPFLGYNTCKTGYSVSK